jgi:hypothetical protein
MQRKKQTLDQKRIRRLEKYIKRLEKFTNRLLQELQKEIKEKYPPFEL